MNIFHTKYKKTPKQKAFTLVEVMVSSSLLLLFAAAFFGGVTFAQQSRTSAALREHADMLAQEGIEASRNIRDSSFSSLVNGSYGLVQSGGVWKFSSSSTDVTSGFTRSVTVSTVDSATKKITSTVSWSGARLKNGTSTMVTYLTNLALLHKQSNTLQVSTAGALLGGVPVLNQLQGITIQNVGTATDTISAITVSWSATVTAKIQQITINGTTVWSSSGPGTPTGAQLTGTQLTIQSYSVAPGSSLIPLVFIFNGAMVLNVYTISFTMSDGTVKTATTGSI